jgi:hypothetical protein
MVDIFEFIESLPTIILAGVVPKLLLLLHQLGRHVIRSCSEPLDDRLGFPAEGLGISQKGKSEVDPIFAVDRVAMQVLGSVLHLTPFRLGPIRRHRLSSEMTISRCGSARQGRR